MNSPQNLYMMALTAAITLPRHRIRTGKGFELSTTTTSRCWIATVDVRVYYMYIYIYTYHFFAFYTLFVRSPNDELGTWRSRARGVFDFSLSITRVLTFFPCRTRALPPPSRASARPNSQRYITEQ